MQACQAYPRSVRSLRRKLGGTLLGRGVMARKVHSDGTVLIWGLSGAIVVSRLAPGVLYVIGVRNFDGPTDDGPMCDFDRELAQQGSLSLFLDVRNVERGSRRSRDAWKEWSTRNRDRVTSTLLVQSRLLHMAISVIAMVSSASTQSFHDESAFLAELTRKVPRIRTLPTVPAWVPGAMSDPQSGLVRGMVP